MKEGGSFSELFGKYGVAFNHMLPWHGGHHADGLDGPLPCLLVYLLLLTECHSADNVT